jgi:hypothetical protein
MRRTGGSVKLATRFMNVHSLTNGRGEPKRYGAVRSSNRATAPQERPGGWVACRSQSSPKRLAPAGRGHGRDDYPAGLAFLKCALIPDNLSLSAALSRNSAPRGSAPDTSSSDASSCSHVSRDHSSGVDGNSGSSGAVTSVGLKLIRDQDEDLSQDSDKGSNEAACDVCPCGVD